MSSNNTANNGMDAFKPPSTLSRNALYTPLIAYDQQNVDPSQYMSARSRGVPTSLRESSLVDFVQTVSTEISDKPLSTQVIDERIRQRALTLVVGGGINSSMTSTGGKQNSNNKRSSSRHYEELSNRQRKKTFQQIQAKDLNRTKQQEDEKVFDTLLKVNRKWNDYVRKLARVDQLLLQDEDPIKTVSSRLAQLEVVGAFVKLITCQAHKEWVGKEGMVVETTTNTWRLAIMKVSDRQTQKQQPKVLVVPKKGSRLMFQLTIGEGRSPLCIVIRGEHETWA
jgi:RNase P/RNase MRP subunit p29